MKKFDETILWDIPKGVIGYFFVSPEKDIKMDTYESQVDAYFLPWNIHKCLVNEPIFFLKLFCLLKFIIIKKLI